MSCIFCGSNEHLDSIEHIVNESLVNYHYTLDKGDICNICNNKFSKFESKVLSKTIIGLERARLGIVTKKGKAAKANTGLVSFKGDDRFRKNLLIATGLKSANTANFDPVNKTFTLKVEGFDKSEMATSKWLLKIGFESIYKSQRNFFNKQDFSELKEHLISNESVDWPFITSQNEINNFKSVVTYSDKYRLKQNQCELMYSEINNLTILFKFRYGGFTGIINLVQRDTEWIKKYLKKAKIVGIYPQSVSKKLQPPAED